MSKKYSLILFLGMILSCNNHTSTKAKIFIENNVIDIGVVSLSDTILKTIQLKNFSKSKLKIDSIGVSCGCTIISYDKFPIPENDSTSLTIQFIAENKGSFKKSIVIDANTHPPFTTLYLTGEVK